MFFHESSSMAMASKAVLYKAVRSGVAVVSRSVSNSVTHFSVNHLLLSRTAPTRECVGCPVESSRFRRQRRARIFEIVSQSLTIAPNVHPSGTSSTSSPATTCWRCQTHPELSRGMAVTPREDRYSSCTVLSTAISLLVSALIKPARFHRDSSLA